MNINIKTAINTKRQQKDVLTPQRLYIKSLSSFSLPKWSSMTGLCPKESSGSGLAQSWWPLFLNFWNEICTVYRKTLHQGVYLCVCSLLNQPYISHSYTNTALNAAKVENIALPFLLSYTSDFSPRYSTPPYAANFHFSLYFSTSKPPSRMKPYTRRSHCQSLIHRGCHSKDWLKLNKCGE